MGYNDGENCNLLFPEKGDKSLLSWLIFAIKIILFTVMWFLFGMAL